MAYRAFPDRIDDLQVVGGELSHAEAREQRRCQACRAEAQRRRNTAPYRPEGLRSAQPGYGLAVLQRAAEARKPLPPLPPRRQPALRLGLRLGTLRGVPEFLGHRHVVGIPLDELVEGLLSLGCPA